MGISRLRHSSPGREWKPKEKRTSLVVRSIKLGDPVP